VVGAHETVRERPFFSLSPSLSRRARVKASPLVFCSLSLPLLRVRLCVSGLRANLLAFLGKYLTQSIFKISPRARYKQRERERERERKARTDRQAVASVKREREREKTSARSMRGTVFASPSRLTSTTTTHRPFEQRRQRRNVDRAQRQRRNVDRAQRRRFGESFRARAALDKDKLRAEVLVKETALKAEEARAKSLLQKVKRLKEEKEKKLVLEQREYEEEKELTENEQRRKVNKEKMKLVGGREPANRPPGPIWASAVVCAVAAVGFYYLTINTSDGIVEYVKDAFGNLGPTYAKSGLVSLTVGTGVVLSSVFAFSSIILVLIGAQETKRLISNEPVVYFRCCGCDERCCQNGPHNKGYSTRFIYRNDGRGYETRSAERMRAHLRVSKNCTPLEPLIVYPREAGWGWWGPNDLVRYQNDMLRMKEQKQGKFR